VTPCATPYNIAISLQQRDQQDGFQQGPQSSQQRPQAKDLITDQMIDTMRQRFPNQVVQVSLSEVVGSGQAKDGRRYNNITLLGANGDYATVNNVTLLKGRFLSVADVKGVRSVAVVSDRLAANLFGADLRSALEQELRVYVGSQNIATNVLVPVSTAKRLTASASGYPSVMVAVAPDVDPIAFADQLQEFFATYYVNNLDYRCIATSMKSITQQIDSVMGSLSIGISVIAGISLLVGGIGVMNIMLVSVTERTREIGLRKAVGATPNNIRLQFIVESTIVCLIGGVLGVLLGGALGYLGSYLLDVPTLPSASSIGIAVGFSVSIGLFFGFYPANRAARLNPIDALRSL